jgi:hypothetical protein
MDAAPASRPSVVLSAIRRGRSRGLTSDHRGTRRAVMIEFYTTVRVTGRCSHSLDPVLLTEYKVTVGQQGLPGA